MKKTMFKIAGVKNDKEFYDKFPTEEAFMAKHGKAFKAKYGGFMKKAQFGEILEGIGGAAGAFGSLGGGTQSGRPKVNSVTETGFQTEGFAGALSGLGGGGQQIGMGGAEKAGGAAGGFMETMGGVQGIGNTIGEIGKGYSQLRAARRARKEAEQWAAVSDVSADAAESVDVDARRQQSDIIQDRYNTQMRPINGEELFPVNGVGTNVLAKSGIHIKPENRGKFTAAAKKMGHSVQEHAKHVLADPNATALQKKRANFARNAAKWKHAQDGAEVMPMQNLEPIDLGQVDDSIWKEKQTQFYMDQMRDWRSKKTGVSPNRKFSQTSPEYMKESARIKKAWHSDNKHLGPLPTLGANDSIPQMQDGGFMKFMGGAGGQGISSMTGNMMGNDGGSQIGGAIGGTIGSAFGPGGKMIGQTLGKVAGGLLDKNKERTEGFQEQTKKNIGRMAWANQNPQTAYTKYGGSFKQGGKKYMQDGGTLMETTGDVTMGPEGNLKPISFNPYTDSGETNLIEGPSHKNGGTRVDYAGNKIEAEREPVMKMAQGGEAEGLVIFGDLPISESTAALIGDPTAKNKKFKTYVEKKAESENKANKKSSKASEIMADLKPINKFDRLKLATQETIIKGSDIKLKNYAEQKENAALAQNAINETAEELGADPKSIAKGKFKKASKSQMAKYGKTMSAQNGTTFESPEDALAAGYEPIPGKKDEYKKLEQEGQDFGDIQMGGSPGIEGRAAVPGRVIKPAKNQMKDWKGYLAKETPEEKQIRRAREVKEGRRTEGISAIEAQPAFAPITTDLGNTEDIYDYARIQAASPANPENKGKFNPMPWLTALAPAFGRGTDAEGLSGNQLLGEMFTLATNKVEPVYAQGYKPELDVPYDISFQDQLNRVTSGVRGAQRMAQGNPAAQAMIQAQGYAQDQPILGEQFRANQGKKDQVYSGSRASLNDAKLKNLGIFADQAHKQSQARSNTKEATRLALNSVSDKYAQNKLEQRTLKTYENMYNYRFRNNYRAQNVNDPVDFQAMKRNAELTGALGGGRGNLGSMEDYEVTGYDAEGNARLKRKGTPSLATEGFNQMAKYGSITKTLKKY